MCGASAGVGRVPGVPLRRVRDARESLAMLGFGPHLVFDGFGCPSTRLSNLDALYRLLDSLPEQIGRASCRERVYVLV